MIRDKKFYTSFLLLFLPITLQSMLALLQSEKVVKIALYLSCISLVINCCINWTLIYGNLGFPRMGVTGAAIGALTARIVELSILIWYIVKKEKNLDLKLKDFYSIDKVLLKDYVKVTAPAVFLKSLWGLNTAMQTVILGHLTSAAIAANSMASNLYLIIKTMATGEASATSVIVGNSIGEGKSEAVIRSYARTFQVLFVLIGLLCGGLMYLLSGPVLSLYSFSDEARMLAREFLNILCIVIMFMSYQMPVNIGIIKGSGDTVYVVKLDLIMIWGVSIPLSLLAAFVFHASPLIVIICLNIDQFVKCIPAFIKVNYGHWIRQLTR